MCADDAKLAALTSAVTGRLGEDFHPTVFCRFVETAGYVATHPRASLGSSVEVAVVTGRLAPNERAELVEQLDAPRVLVATESEGVNLQGRFDAVVHYDLSWNPNRHEQRAGRVDRFGQPAALVRSVTLIREDNAFDRAVLAVLLGKQPAIHHRLGIHVPVPRGTEEPEEELVREALSARNAAQLPLFEELPAARQLELAWEGAAERTSLSEPVCADGDGRLQPGVPSARWPVSAVLAQPAWRTRRRASSDPPGSLQFQEVETAELVA